MDLSKSFFKSVKWGLMSKEPTFEDYHLCLVSCPTGGWWFRFSKGEEFIELPSHKYDFHAAVATMGVITKGKVAQLELLSYEDIVEEKEDGRNRTWCYLLEPKLEEFLEKFKLRPEDILDIGDVRYLTETPALDTDYGWYEQVVEIIEKINQTVLEKYAIPFYFSGVTFYLPKDYADADAIIPAKTTWKKEELCPPMFESENSGA